VNIKTGRNIEDMIKKESMKVSSFSICYKIRLRLRMWDWEIYLRNEDKTKVKIIKCSNISSRQNNMKPNPSEIHQLRHTALLSITRLLSQCHIYKKYSFVKKSYCWSNKTLTMYSASYITPHSKTALGNLQLCFIHIVEQCVWNPASC